MTLCFSAAAVGGAAAATTPLKLTQPLRTQIHDPPLLPTRIKLFHKCKPKNHFRITVCHSSSESPFTVSTTEKVVESRVSPDLGDCSSSTDGESNWVVTMEKPEKGVGSKSEAIDFCVKTLARVLGSEKEAQLCMYNVSWETNFGFCCEVDAGTSSELAGLPEVLSVRPDRHINLDMKDYRTENYRGDSLFNLNDGTLRLFPEGSSKYWLVRVGKPSVEVVTKVQMVDYYVNILSKVLGNEVDAQMCIYHMSFLHNFGFCCELDDECARELAAVPAVLSVLPDENFGSENKNYAGGDGDGLQNACDQQTSNIKTKRLFVTGLSFYTSEKTLRAAFEGFGELVEVKIIMDKISKRSKGYAFLEYTTEEAAAAALKEMNGKIINGWMIVVDVAKTNPPKYTRGRPQPPA
ncbi:hypothetical protein Sjap_001189 [Stephania japonica]|uniref:RRM domain-containing protein n=1 Tax=Stephania japonica TaxID=461633 RepID=A0AAP0KL88_9MAGN